MNPHFVFNALNSVQRYILDQNELAANHYLTQFSYLMRLFLESSKSKYIHIEQEIELLTLYTDLEKLRFKDQFTCIIELDKRIDPRDEIFSMFIQPFVENAINHGLLYKSTPGDLQITFTPKGKNIFCVVEDNGVGRKKAGEIKEKSFKSHKSRAMQITQERLEALNFIENTGVEVTIIDKKDEGGNACGTRVEIILPVI